MEKDYGKLLKNYKCNICYDGENKRKSFVLFEWLEYDGENCYCMLLVL